MKTFKNKVLLIGFGAVGRCALPILVKHLHIPYKNITVLDFVNKRKELAPWIKKGVRYSQERISPVNVARTLSKYVSPGGLIIDLAWNIDTIDMLNWCHENRVLYANTSVEEWDPYVNIEKKTPLGRSLYIRHIEIRQATAKWGIGSPTAVIDHGANPGLISHFTKCGLVDIGNRAMREKALSKTQRRILERLIRERKFASLAMKLGVKTVHISERDTQVTRNSKQVDEFVGTWSIEGLREEAMAPSELGWGTHEKEIPLAAYTPVYGPKNQIFFSQMGMNTWVRSWVPNYEIIGMVIRHSEAFTISEKLTVWRRGRPVYRPTVNYAYMPCDETIASLHELRSRNYEIQPRTRIMSDDIVSGADILGALIMGHRYNSWWTGSVLSIEKSRKLVPRQNATTMQVAIGLVAAVMWMLDNPRRGVCVPDDLPYDKILKTAKPYLGTFISDASEWTPFTNYQSFFKENPDSFLDKKNPWNFKNFLFKP